MIYFYKEYKIIQTSKPGFYIYVSKDSFECLHTNSLEDAKRVIDYLIKE